MSDQDEKLASLKADFEPIYGEVDEYIDLENRIATSKVFLSGIMAAKPKLPPQVEDIATYFEYQTKYVRWDTEKQAAETTIVEMQKRRDELLRIFTRLLPEGTWFKHGNIGFGFIRGTATGAIFCIEEWQEKMPSYPFVKDK